MSCCKIKLNCSIYKQNKPKRFRKKQQEINLKVKWKEKKPTFLINSVQIIKKAWF